MTTFTDVFKGLFGAYSPVPVFDADLNIIDYTFDFAYIGAVVLFIVILVCCFKLGGAIIGRKCK